ncbi:hypothetical protein BJX96DRAFT_157895 [Aspergillus floccosus]
MQLVRQPSRSSFSSRLHQVERQSQRQFLLGVELPRETGLVQLARGLVGTGTGPRILITVQFFLIGGADVGNVVLVHVDGREVQRFT